MKHPPLWCRCQFFIMFLICALSAAICVPEEAAAQGQRRPIASLLAAGPYVRVNGGSAVNGMSIYSGDTVVTGPDSSAQLFFVLGGSVQLNANTDPQFLEFIQGAYGCLVHVVLNSGEVYSEGSNACISHGPTWVIPSSEFNLLVSPRGEVLTVTAGKVVAGGEQRVVLAAGTQGTLAGGRLVAQRQVNAEEVRRIIGWRHRYRFAPASPPYVPQLDRHLPQLSPDHAPLFAPGPPTCPRDSVYDAERRTCVPVFTPGSPTCPPGSVYDPRRRTCAPAAVPRPPTCPRDSVYDAARRTCVPLIR